MLENFHFLRPEWLLALVPLLIVAIVWLRRNQRGSGWDSAIDDALLNVLLDGGQRASHRFIRWVLLGALALGCVGIAGPTWEKLPQSVEQRDDALIILLDLSLSMLAEDVKPTRVERARQEITDVLRLREEGQTALIAYAGDAHAVVPLTDDTATISNLLAALSPEMMPVFGSNPDHALQLAHELFDNGSVLQGRILMVTDGIDNINDVTRHRSAAFPISILGIGTPDGAPIPLDRVRQPGRTLRTQEGNEIIAIVDEGRLRDVASITFGAYARATLGDADISELLSTPLPGEDSTIEVEREFDTWFDQGHWLVLFLLPAMLLAFRRGVFVCLLFGVALTGEDARANTLTDAWDSLWLRDDQRAHQSLRHGEPEKAAALFKDPRWQPVAEYRSGNYATSLNGFAQDATLTGRYNEGNSLAQLGEYEAAIAAYDEVLGEDPEHEDAAFNKALVERLLEEQQQAEQQQQQDDSSQANNENSDSEQQSQEQQEQSDQQQESEDTEQQQNEQEQQQSEEEGEEQQTAQAEENEATRDEKQEALEQWLRRVPDDPGGLLRRKFSHETKQRLRSGDYENRQGSKLW